MWWRRWRHNCNESTVNMGNNLRNLRLTRVDSMLPISNPRVTSFNSPLYNCGNPFYVLFFGSLGSLHVLRWFDYFTRIISHVYHQYSRVLRACTFQAQPLRRASNLHLLCNCCAKVGSTLLLLFTYSFCSVVLKVDSVTLCVDTE